LGGVGVARGAGATVAALESAFTTDAGGGVAGTAVTGETGVAATGGVVGLVTAGFSDWFAEGPVGGFADGCSSEGLGFAGGVGGGETWGGKGAVVSATRSGVTDIALDGLFWFRMTISASATTPATFRPMPNSVKRRWSTRDMNHARVIALVSSAGLCRDEVLFTI
jgi:hypothetical protein